MPIAARFSPDVFAADAMPAVPQSGRFRAFALTVIYHIFRELYRSARASFSISDEDRDCCVACASVISRKMQLIVDEKCARFRQ